VHQPELDAAAFDWDRLWEILLHAKRSVACASKARKVFFFEKKKQKTFVCLVLRKVTHEHARR
jgi:hypothetical protein